MSIHPHGTDAPGGDVRLRRAAGGLPCRSVRDLLGSLLGVPAVMFLSGGLGIVAVTLYSRLRRHPDRPPIRWAHLVFGIALSAAGALLVQLDVALLGVR